MPGPNLLSGSLVRATDNTYKRTEVQISACQVLHTYYTHERGIIDLHQFTDIHYITTYCCPATHQFSGGYVIVHPPNSCRGNRQLNSIQIHNKIYQKQIGENSIMRMQQGLYNSQPLLMVISQSGILRYKLIDLKIKQNYIYNIYTDGFTTSNSSSLV